MLRSHYTGLVLQANRHPVLLRAGSWLLAGCSMSVPVPGADDAPRTTGSIGSTVEVQQPLPQTLAYSDASKIGQAAATALWQVDKKPSGDWVNTATGSSGTVEDSGAQEEDTASGGCRIFNTMVTSFAGVHQYSGKICRAENGRSFVQIGS